MFDLQRIMTAASEDVLRQMPAAVIIAEAPSGKIIFRNSRAQQIWELSPSQARVTKLEDASDFQIFHPDGRRYEMEQWPLMRSIRDGEEVRDEEFVYPLADGTQIFLRCNSSPIYDDEGRIVAGVLGAQDITERKKAEEQLAYHAHLLEKIHDAVIATDERLNVTAWNKSAERMYGWRADEALGRNLRELILRGVDDEQVNESLGELAQRGRLRTEAIRYRKDGTTVYVEGITVALRGEQGEATGYVGITRDVTERKRTEEELKEASREVEDILERITDAFVAVNREWRYTYINELALDNIRAAKREELSREEILGKSMWEMFPEGVGSVFHKRYLEALREQKTVHFEAYSPLRERWVEHHAYPSEDGLAIFYQDITERKRAEKEIEARTHQQAVVAELGLWALANKDLQALMEDTAAFVAQTLDVEYCKIVELLPGGEKLLLRAGVGWEEGLVGNVTEDAGLGSQSGYTLHLHEPVIMEDLSAETRFTPPLLLREHGVVGGMTVVIAGRERPFGVLGAHTQSLRAFSEDDVNFLQAVANVLAMAIERKETEERLEEVREAERSRIARDLHDEALQDLTDAAGEAQRIRSISEEPELTRRLGRLETALWLVGQQLRGAIYDLRLDREQDKPFDALLEKLVELQRSMAPECDIALEVHDGVLSGRLGERGRQLLRILGEALTNVRRHAGASHVRVGVGIAEDRLWAKVQDDGRGFDATQEGSEQALSAGGGLGIRGMRERARALGGDLKIESDPERGTKVRFELALEPEPEQPEEKEEEVRVLLVEDHASIREALASTFEGEGFEVVGQAGLLADARRRLREAQPIDVAIIDLGLPDGYGGDLIKDLREAYPHAQALVLSATLDRTEVARAVEKGAAGILNKSAHLEEVVEAIRRLRRGETLLPLQEVVELLRFAGSRREEDYEARQAIAKLTAREIEVLQALAEGLDGEGIADRLNIALRTERNHMTSILAKLGVHSQLQALVFALRHGVVKVR